MVDGPLAVRDTGEGPAIVFLHAFPLESSQWDHQVAALSGDFRCLRYDMPGCGDAPPPWPGLTLDEVALAIDADLAARGVAPATVVGLSMGGYVAMAMVRRVPHRLRALVLAATRATADTDDARANRLAMAEQLRRDGVEAIVESTIERLVGPWARDETHVTDPIRGRIRRCTAAGLAACQEAMAARPDSHDALGACGLPILCIAGADDAVVPVSEMRALADLCRGPLVVVENAGHLVNLEQPERFTEAVADFLRGLGPD